MASTKKKKVVKKKKTTTQKNNNKVNSNNNSNLNKTNNKIDINTKNEKKDNEINSEKNENKNINSNENNINKTVSNNKNKTVDNKENKIEKKSQKENGNKVENKLEGKKEGASQTPKKVKKVKKVKKKGNSNKENNNKKTTTKKQLNEDTKNKELNNGNNIEQSKEENKDTAKNNANSNNNKLIKESKKKSDKKDEKPEYVQEMIKKRKRKMSILINSSIVFVCIIGFSTFFAINNTRNVNIIQGISIKNNDISALSKEDAKTKISKAINKELIAEIDLKYNDNYEITLKPEQIEFKYNLDEAIERAYAVGRDGNIVQNNYAIILAAILEKNIDISYTYNEELLNQFVNDINAKLPGVVVEPTYYMENEKLIVNKGIDGIQIKKEELKKQIIDQILARNALEMTDGFKQTINLPIENAKASSIDMDKIYSEIHTHPKDAYYETDPYKIYPDVDGIDLAISVEEAKNQITSEDKQEYSFDLKITKAEKTIDDLGTEAFPYLVSSFSTKYDASNRNRSTNLEIAARKINGKVLMPGEEFSYNKIVGKRTVEEGYKDAKIYADGGVVDGLAGGICQISSTLYNAVLLANLQVTERRNHTYTTSYVPAGRDATVVWGTTDFKFVNSRTTPIKLEATVNNGIAEFKIHGMQEEVEYEVKILPVKTKSLPYATTYVEDASLLPGQQVRSQAGHAGYKVTTYKELRRNGEVVSKEVISNDTYSPMKTIIRVGPGGTPAPAPAAPTV